MEIFSLVTGGAGFMGSHVVNHLLDQGHNVVALDDLSGGFKKNVNPAATLHVGSITDQVLIEQLFAKYKFNYVYHLAAYAAEGLSPFIRRFNYENNLIGSINLINAAVNHDVKCFVFTSSIAVYGTQSLQLTEEMMPQPEDPYGIAKYAVELDLQAAHKMFGLNYVIFRPHNVYGVNQNIDDKYRNVVGIFISQILQGQPLTIFGDGQQTRSFTCIEDVAPYIADAVNISNAYNQVFNIGSGEIHTVNALANIVSKTMGSKVNIQKLEKRDEAIHSIAGHEKFEAVFNPRETVGLENGLSEMIEWAKTREPGSGRDIATIEIEKNLPPSWK